MKPPTAHHVQATSESAVPSAVAIPAITSAVTG